MKLPIYLDNHATTPVDPRVLETMIPYFTDNFGNAASRNHPFGWQAEEAVEVARAEIGKLIGVTSKEIIFTSGATESDNLAIMGVVEMYKEKGNHIITSTIEHKAILDTCKYLEQHGCKVTYVRVDKTGRVAPEDVRAAITDKTILISIMFANNEIGTIQPIAEIGKIAKEKSVIFHTDAVQAIGKVPVNVEEMGIDLLSLSAHKMYGPKGVGALYIRRGITFHPFIVGGHQERNRRGGTENVAGIVGMGMAAEVALKHLGEEDGKVRPLRDQLERSLLDACPGCRVNGHREKRIPNTSNVSFKFLEGEAILVLLDQYGICASTGSACTAGSVEPSHVLRAMGVPPDWIQGAVRFSLSRYSTEQEVRFVSEKVPLIVQRLQGLSALGKLGHRQEAQRSDYGTGDRAGARR